MPENGFTLETEFLRRKDTIWRWLCIGGTILNAAMLPLVVWILTSMHGEQLRNAVNAVKMAAKTAQTLTP